MRRQYECTVFNNDCNDNGLISGVVCNDSVKPAGRPSTSEERFRIKGLQVRDISSQPIYENGMHRPRKDM